MQGEQQDSAKSQMLEKLQWNIENDKAKVLYLYESNIQTNKGDLIFFLTWCIPRKELRDDVAGLFIMIYSVTVPHLSNYSKEHNFLDVH